MKKTFYKQKGQALITMIFVSVIGITIISAAAIFILQNIQGANVAQQGLGAYYLAETGAQEALLRLVRDPSYTGTAVNQPLVVQNGSFSGTVTIQTSTASGKVISIGNYNNAQRKIQVNFVYNNSTLTVSSWKEVQ